MFSLRVLKENYLECIFILLLLKIKRLFVFCVFWCAFFFLNLTFHSYGKVLLEQAYFSLFACFLIFFVTASRDKLALDKR